MDLYEYFENTKGLGVLGTCDAQGNVDLAVYARPHVVDESTIAFIMQQRLSHQNLRTNPHAAYLFKEDGPGYKGKRLYLTETSEEINSSLIAKLRRRKPKACPDDDSIKYLVFFHIDRIRPLVGDEKPNLDDSEFDIS
jgi:hypothetical protein